MKMYIIATCPPNQGLQPTALDAIVQRRG